MRNRILSLLGNGVLLSLGITLLNLGCAGVVKAPQVYDYFSLPDPRDAWSPKIAGWQRREKADDGAFLPSGDRSAVSGAPLDDEPLAVSEAPANGEQTDARSPEKPVEFLPDPGLRGKYFEFRAERRRMMARELADWIQSQARVHYIADGPIDHWATLEETLRRDGDDCDGLELLVYHALRDLGFDENEVYRSIVYRPSDGQHHMVTLWFEDRYDPWVIDPTGAMTRGMPRMSDMPDWVPLKVFSETEEFTVRLEDAPPLASGSFAHNP